MFFKKLLFFSLVFNKCLRASLEDVWNNRTEIERSCIITASLLFISIFSQQSNPHAYSACRRQSGLRSRQYDPLHGEVLPASSGLFVDSSLMKIRTVQNCITEHKAMLHVKYKALRTYYCISNSNYITA